MKVEITTAAFNPWQRLQEHETGLDSRRQCGAAATFVGTMRDFNDGDMVQALWLEHYPGMTEGYLQQISASARQRWGLLDSLIIHRVGAMQPGDTIVLVAAWAAHRAEAFAACRYLIEELKARAPFWKRETRPGGERWVEHNTPADPACDHSS
jgi:molybdopterin synthase catalytic subunit